MNAQRGMTLVEILVAIAVSGIALGALMALLVNSSHAYYANRQRQEMTRLADNAIQQIADLFMQAGADLPKDVAVVTANDTSHRDVTVLVNEKGAHTMILQQLASTRNVPVEDAAPFDGLRKLTMRENSSSPSFVERIIDTAFSDGSFDGGVDTANDTIRLTEAIPFYVGDQLYAYTTYRMMLDSAAGKVYRYGETLDGARDTLELAAQAADFKVYFFTANHAATTAWATMAECSVAVTVHASRPVRGYPDPLAHRISRGRVFLLRNKSL